MKCKKITKPDSFRLQFITAFVIINHSFCFGQADEHLSNLLSPTSVNQHLLPDVNCTRDLGAPTKTWRDLYMCGYVYIDGARFISNPATNNTYVGSDAGTTTGTGSFNSGFGFWSLTNNAAGGSNSAFGYNSLQKNTDGSYNSAFGNSSMTTNTTGNNNAAFGRRSMYLNTTGSDNAAFGYNALYSNTVGASNTATGENSLYSNTTATGNTANGYNALYYNTTGGGNTASGSYSLFFNTTGNANAASGYNALYNNATGIRNSAMGYNALNNNNAGNRNTAIGFSALSNNINENNNTAIGFNANIPAGAGITNSTVIGANAVVTAPNTIQLGSTVNIIDISGGMTVRSDGRFKEAVKDNNVPGLALINKLRPVTYNFNYKKYDDFTRKNLKDKTIDDEYQNTLLEKSKIRETGFIAQEVNSIVQENNFTFNGIHTPQNENDHYGLDYSLFVVPLVKAVQELSKQNEDLQKQINELKAVNIAASKKNSSTSISQTTIAVLRLSKTLQILLQMQQLLVTHYLKNLPLLKYQLQTEVASY